MPVVGTILKETTKYISKFTLPVNEKGVENQKKQLKKLLSKAKKTEFGKEHQFSQVLKSQNIETEFKNKVPLFNYELMFQKYWHKTLNGVEDISWPGKIKNFALTSGTTGSSSKKIPVSEKMISSIKKTGVKQFLSLAKMDLPADFYKKDILFLGGSTNLNAINDHFEGDLSGIITGKVPSWLVPFSKPDRKIRALKDWELKITEIIKNAPKWDIGIICGVPSWVQIMIERIIDFYGLDSIFDLWPNVRFYVHGGVSFDPYILSFNELFDDKVIYLDSYLTSEGFFAYQPLNSDSLELITNNGTYYEFIPFNATNFNSSGELINYDNALSLAEVETNQDYALVITTNSGTWRYLIGDTIKFTCLNSLKLKITGRTKHYLSLCGEHLSIDNMTQALTKVCVDLQFDVREFAVLGKMNDESFSHQWFISSDKAIEANIIKDRLDDALCSLNDDYALERRFALRDIDLFVIPTAYFYEFMKLKDKYGAQHKFPRVLKNKLANDWIDFLTIHKGLDLEN